MGKIGAIFRSTWLGLRAVYNTRARRPSAFNILLYNAYKFATLITYTSGRQVGIFRISK